MSALKSIEMGLNLFNRWLGQIVSVFTIAMAMLMFIIVVLRYGFNMGWIALQESVTYLHAAVFLLGAAYTMQLDGHVRVDVFYRGFSKRKKAIVDFLGTCLFLLPMSLFIFVVSWQYVAESWATLESSMESGGLPFLYVLKSFILLFAGALILQGISELIKNASIIKSSQKE